MMPDPDRHRVVPADLVNPDGAADVANKTLEFLGGIDIILHVAGGGLGLRDPLLSRDELSRLVSLNILAAVELNRLLLTTMMQQEKGNVVHVCSIASQEATASVGYNTVKAGFAAYVRSLGREIARSGVVATGIMPGAFWAPDNSWFRLQANKPDVVQKFTEERLPRKRIGEASEIVPLVLFLCSDEASMMAGCLVPIDAGEGKAYAS
jgi:3-oxoacyl-[acyl-carrier protein] reductase